jgi:transposase
MSNSAGIHTEIENIDEIPVIYGLLQKMKVQETVDQVIHTHGNWQGLSVGWVITIWLIHILSQHTHQMDCVQSWAAKRLTLLQKLTGQTIHELDFTDDRLALCLLYLSKDAHWTEIESRLLSGVIQVYDLKNNLPERWTVRLDATVGKVSHDSAQHTLFQVGKDKDGLYGPLFKMMVASLDPLGLPVAVDVVAGNRADDPLYLPSYERLKSIIPTQGLLVVGDSKMSALLTRATIAAGGDHYLVPLAHLKDEPQLLAELLTKQFQAEEEGAKGTALIFLEPDLPSEGQEVDKSLAIAKGFRTEHQRSALVDGQEVTWTEQLLVVCSFSYQKSLLASLQQRLDKAEQALRALTPKRSRGKKQISDEASLLVAIQQIEKKYQVQGLLACPYTSEVTERVVRKYKDRPEHTERQVRFQLTVSREQEAITLAEAQMGWRIYATNAPQEELSLDQAVWAYRGQYLVENIFRRLQGKILSITPVYVQRDDHACGLFHLLTIASRLLALGDYTAKEALARQDEVLTGVYAGNPKRGTATPTMERMLAAFDNIHLLTVRLGPQVRYQVTPLSPVQERVLALLGLPTTLYTALTLDSILALG